MKTNHISVANVENNVTLLNIFIKPYIAAKLTPASLPFLRTPVARYKSELAFVYERTREQICKYYVHVRD